MRKVNYLLCVLALMHTVYVAGQTRSELRETFFSAEGDILFEDYAEALPKYLKLLQTYPENYNYYYRIGQCYINTPGEKEKSIPYLETAVKHINPKYHEGKVKEDGAPTEALYYLANAYRVNNELDKALETYNLFMKDINPRIYDTALIRAQIRSCIIARELMADPVYLVEKNAGNTLNDRFSEFAPAVSDNSEMFVFTRELQFYDAVFYSRKVNGQWAVPVNMTPQLGIDQDYFSSSLSGDGKTLLLYRTDNYEGNIYISRFENDKWSPVEKLNENINTKYWESHATMSSDGRKLYFTSNRKGSSGGLDIYVSELDSTGSWGPAANLGPVINTPYNEETPFLANSDRTLFFSSRGHNNMGGYDIFRSDLGDDGKWGTPVNLGYPVNTTDDDLFFKPVGEGNRGFISKFSATGYGKMDIYLYEIYSDKNPRRFLVTGRATIKNLLEAFPERISVSAASNTDLSRVVTTVTDPATGLYSLSLPHGSFRFTFSGDGAPATTRDFELPLTYRGDTVMLETVELPNNDYIADLRLMTDTMLSVTDGKPIQFNLSTEPRSILKIEQYSGDSIIYSEVHTIADTAYSYALLPREGNTRATFSLTDRFGNIASATVNINRETTEKIAAPQYETLVAQKQVASLLEILKKYSGSEVRKVLDKIDPVKDKSATCDDLLDIIKNRASGEGIAPGVIDRLALEVATREGILTQAATDILRDHADDPVRENLSEIDIYDLRLKNWNDLTGYVSSESEGKVTDKDLRDLAGYILMAPEPGISLIRDKVLYAASLVPDSALIRQAVISADSCDFKYTSDWLLYIVNACRTDYSAVLCARLIAAISHIPGAGTSDMINDLALNSDLQTAEYLRSLDLRSLKIKTPRDLISYLNNNAGKGSVNGGSYSSALAQSIIKTDLSDKDIYANMTEKHQKYWLGIIAGIGLAAVLLIVLGNRRKRNKEQQV